MTVALVTGGSGFIGATLIDALARGGYTVHAVGRTPLTQKAVWRYADLNDPPSLEGCAQGAEVVCHLAGAAHVNAPRAVHERITVAGTRALLAQARSAGVRRFVFVSSIKASCSDDAYAESRRLAEQMVLAETAMVGHVVRPALVYGPGMKGNLSRLLAWAARPVPLPIPRGLAVRSLVHRDDLIAVIMALLRTEQRFGPLVVSDGQPYTLWDIYSQMRTACRRGSLRHGLPASWVHAMARAGDQLSRWTRRAMPFDSAALKPLLESCYDADDTVWSALSVARRFTLASALPDIVGTRHVA